MLPMTLINFDLALYKISHQELKTSLIIVIGLYGIEIGPLIQLPHADKMLYLHKSHLHVFGPFPPKPFLAMYLSKCILMWY